MTIDFHTHCFPEKIAAKAVQKLSYDSGGLIPQTDGTVSSLKEHMAKCGVDKSVILNIATNEHQQTSVNDFAASLLNDEKLIPFGSVYPRSENVFEELERIKALGLKGIKLHPEYQNFFVDDDFMKPIYRKISELGLIVVFHAGEDYGYAGPYHATPERLRKAAFMIDSPMVAAHWGSAGMGEQVLKYLADLPIFFDTAFGYATQPRQRAMAILEKHGVERMLFASDCPWHSPAWERKLLETLELTNEELEQIYHKNAEKLLGL